MGVFQRPRAGWGCGDALPMSGELPRGFCTVHFPRCLAVADSEFPSAKSCRSLVLVSINSRDYFLPHLPFRASENQQTALPLAMFGRCVQFSKYTVRWADGQYLKATR